MGIFVHYLMRLMATWGASCRHDSASPETGAWPSQVTSPNLASRHCHFQPLGVITKIWVGWENVWRWCWQSDCEYIGLLPLPQSGVSVITFIGKTQHWWSGGAEGEHCYGFCKEIQTCQSHKVSQNFLLNYPLKTFLSKNTKMFTKSLSFVTGQTYLLRLDVVILDNVKCI